MFEIIVIVLNDSYGSKYTRALCKIIHFTILNSDNFQDSSKTRRALLKLGAQGRTIDAFVRVSPFLRWPAVDQDASVRPHRPFHCCSWPHLATHRMLTAICAGGRRSYTFSIKPGLGNAYDARRQRKEITRGKFERTVMCNFNTFWLCSLTS